MRANLMYGAGDVRVENVPDSPVKHPTDALVRVTASCICGSDLQPLPIDDNRDLRTHSGGKLGSERRRRLSLRGRIL
jgi:hypothetical protein